MPNQLFHGSSAVRLAYLYTVGLPYQHLYDADSSLIMDSLLGQKESNI